MGTLTAAIIMVLLAASAAYGQSHCDVAQPGDQVGTRIQWCHDFKDDTGVVRPAGEMLFRLYIESDDGLRSFILIPRSVAKSKSGYFLLESTMPASYSPFEGDRLWLTATLSQESLPSTRLVWGTMTLAPSIPSRPRLIQ